MNDNGMISIPVSVGDLFDRVSVLDVKKNKIKDTSKLFHIKNEHKLLKPMCEDLISSHPELKQMLIEITEVNSSLWDILELQRVKEKSGELDQKFIDLSISVYKENDKRFFIKNKINKITSSKIEEQKYYTVGQ
jgi:hypothetical protein